MRKKISFKTLYCADNSHEILIKERAGTKGQIVIVYNQYIIISFLQFRVISKAFENKSSILISLWKESKCTSLKVMVLLSVSKQQKRQSSQET
jgi:hypothetical protein